MLKYICFAIFLSCFIMQVEYVRSTTTGEVHAEQMETENEDGNEDFNSFLQFFCRYSCSEPNADSILKYYCNCRDDMNRIVLRHGKDSTTKKLKPNDCRLLCFLGYGGKACYCSLTPFVG